MILYGISTSKHIFTIYLYQHAGHHHQGVLQVHDGPQENKHEGGSQGHRDDTNNQQGEELLAGGVGLVNGMLDEKDVKKRGLDQEVEEAAVRAVMAKEQGGASKWSRSGDL